MHVWVSQSKFAQWEYFIKLQIWNDSHAYSLSKECLHIRKKYDFNTYSPLVLEKKKSSKIYWNNSDVLMSVSRYIVTGKLQDYVKRDI
jgi:hypothetical protein